MANPKIGIKCFPDNIESRIKLSGIDYIEVQVMPAHKTQYHSSAETSIEDLMQYKGKILAVHGAHLDHGVNPANPHKIEKNEYAMEMVKRAATVLNSKYIIFHPGFMEAGAQETCSLKEAKNFFSDQNRDRTMIADEITYLMRLDNGGYEKNKVKIEELNYSLNNQPEILLENIPAGVPKDSHLHVWPYLEPEDIKRFSDLCRMRSCLDVAHAAINSLLRTPGKPVENEIFELIKILNPPYFHICNTDGRRDHLNLHEGLVNIERIVERVKDRAVYLTIEVDNPLQSDVDLVRRVLDNDKTPQNI
jgi:endonuclease IV